MPITLIRKQNKHIFGKHFERSNTLTWLLMNANIL